jgi:hypothetical protein
VSHDLASGAASGPPAGLVAKYGEHLGRRGVCEDRVGFSRQLEVDGGRRITLTETRARHPGHAVGRGSGSADLGFELVDDLGSAPGAAAYVVADVSDTRRPLLGVEQRIEAGDSEGVRRRDQQPAAHVVHRPLRNPADLALNGVKRGQQQVPAGG